MKKIITNLPLIIFPFTIALPLIPLKITAIAFIIFCVGILFDSKSKLTLKFNFNDKLIILCVLFFLTDAFGNLMRLEFSEPFFRSIKFSFLIAPILFIYRADKVKLNFNLITTSFTYGALAYVLYAWWFVLDFYFITNPGYRLFSFTDGYIFYMLYNYLPGAIHHTYIGIYIVFAIILLLNKIKNESRNKVINSLMVILLNFSLFYIGGKSSFILLFILVFIYLIYLKKIILNLIFSLFFFGGLFLVKRWVTGIALENSINSRLKYYECSFNIIKEFFFTGIGQSNFSKASMLICNTEILIPHNLFIRAFLTNGIISFLIVFALCALLLINSVKKKDIVYISLTILLIVGGLTEDLLYLQRGVLFFVPFLSLYYVKHKDFNTSILH